jgi:hypothetical protein
MSDILICAYYKKLTKNNIGVITIEISLGYGYLTPLYFYTTDPYFRQTILRFFAPIEVQVSNTYYNRSNFY